MGSCFDVDKIVSEAGNVPRCKELATKVQTEISDERAGKGVNVDAETIKKEQTGLIACLRDRFHMDAEKETTQADGIRSFVNAVAKPDKKEKLLKVVEECLLGRLVPMNSKDQAQQLNICFLAEAAQACS